MPVFTAQAHAEAPSWSGQVVRVLDGDTLELLNQQQTTRVRLAQIDAPEKGQAFNARAKQALANLCAAQTAHITPIDTDRYGRTVAWVTCQDQDANATLVAQGLAWVYTRYAPKDSPLLALQAKARQSKAGLWVDAAPVPPWEWRRAIRERRSPAPQLIAPPHP